MLLKPARLKLASMKTQSSVSWAPPRQKEPTRPGQTPEETARPDLILGTNHPRLDHPLAGGAFPPYPRNLATRAGFDEQASTKPGSSADADGQAVAWSRGHQTTVSALGSGRPGIVAKVSDVRCLARYRPRERLAPRYGAPDNCQQNCVYSRRHYDGVFGSCTETTTNTQHQPPAARLAR